MGQITHAVVREANVPAGPCPGQYGAGGDVVGPAVLEGEPQQDPAVVVDECGALAPHVVEPFVGLLVGAEAWTVTSVPTAGRVVAERVRVAEPVRVRRLTDQEGRKLQQIVRRGSTSSVAGLSRAARLRLDRL
ncbi:hypothetical protein [Streptomyces sp. NPDC093261]|uniref:hypothetical protein n=1 Tax=Streptomyces sp. NPDC093261 TaxID=3366037 RepID=UPI00381405DF